MGKSEESVANRCCCIQNTPPRTPTITTELFLSWPFPSPAQSQKNVHEFSAWIFRKIAYGWISWHFSSVLIAESNTNAPAPESAPQSPSIGLTKPGSCFF
jgi:hypothetical protein